MNVWSLFVTIATVNPKFSFLPVPAARNPKRYPDVLVAIRAAARIDPQLAPMAREIPEHRASAAQMLVALFESRGMSTPMADVPPIASVPSA